MIDQQLLETTLQDIIYKFQPLSRGGLSEIFLLQGKKSCYILKRPGADAQEVRGLDRLQKDYRLSHEMMNNAYSFNKVKSYGIFVGEDGIPYHLQDYVSGQKFRRQDYSLDQLRMLGKWLGTLHALQIPETLTTSDHHINSLKFFLESPDGILKQREIYGLSHSQAGEHLLTLYRETSQNLSLENPQRRSVMLQGDFSASNIFLDDHTIRCIDFSRIAYGEAAIDVGLLWSRLYMDDSLDHQDPHYRRSQEFLDAYRTTTKDEAIVGYVSLGLLYTSYLALGDSLLDSQSKQQIYQTALKYITQEKQ